MSHNWQQILQQLATSGKCALDQLHPHARKFLCEENNSNSWLIACSGGSDSVFLVLMLAVLFPQKKKDFVIVHYNHKMRGAASDADQQYVAQLARGLDIKYHSASSDVSNENQSHHSEEVLRAARMHFFKETLQQHQSNVLILGHQMNDVLETMLMRLSRGSSLTGLIAPRPVHRHPHAVFVRPLIALHRETIQDILKSVNVQWREDSSNQEGTYYRNSLRLEVIPRWRAALVDKQQERDLFASAAYARDLLEEDETALQHTVDQLWPKLFDAHDPSQSHLNTAPLKTLPKALVRRTLYRWLNQQNLSEGISATLFEKLLEFCIQSNPIKISITPDLWLELDNKGVLQCAQAAIVETWTNRYELTLHQPSLTTLPDGMRVGVEVLDADNTLIEKILSKQVDNRHEAYLSADGLNKQLDKVVIRTWNPGDRYQPLGAPGNRKLQDLFIDRKIAHCKKHQLPILLLNDERNVIWVPNLPPAESFRIFPTTKHLLKLTYHPS